MDEFVWNIHIHIYYILFDFKQWKEMEIDISLSSNSIRQTGKWIFSNDSCAFCSLKQFVNCLIIIICHFPFSFINSSAFIDLLGANKIFPV